MISAYMGSRSIHLSDTANALTVSLWLYVNSVWNPNHCDIQLRCDVSTPLCFFTLWIIQSELNGVYSLTMNSDACVSDPSIRIDPIHWWCTYIPITVVYSEARYMYAGNEYRCCATTDVTTPSPDNDMHSSSSYPLDATNKLLYCPVLLLLDACVISLILFPSPLTMLRYMCPDHIAMIPIAR